MNTFRLIRRGSSRRAVAGLLVLVIVLACPVAAAAGVQLAILPAMQTVAPGSEFEVTLQVTSAGSSFNGFHLLIDYDPAALTPVPLSPLRNQLGLLETSVCSTIFHQFRYGGGVDSVDVSLMCPGTSMTGPGPIYRVRFRASATVSATTLAIRPDVVFAENGILVTGISTSAAAIGIGMTPVLGVGDGPAPAALSFSAAPNPSRGEVAFAFGPAPGAGAQLRVLDVQGRSIRMLAVPAGARTVRWDGRGEGGARLAPGLYLAELRRDAYRDVVRVAIVR